MFSNAARTGLRRLAADRSGAGAVEFALVAPAFLAVVFGLFEFGWTQHCISSMNFALREASRSLVIDPELTEDELEAQVTDQLEGIADDNVVVTLDIVENADGRVADLTGTMARNIVVPLLATYPVTYTSTVSAIIPDV